MQQCYPNQKDKQMKATLNLKLFGTRLIDLTIGIENINNVLNDPNSTNREKKTSLSIIKNTIFPFLDCTVDVCTESSKILSPIPSLKYVHRGKENEIRQDIKKLVNGEKNKY